MQRMSSATVSTDLLIIGAGPAGAAAAFHAARAGRDTLLIDMAQLPGRDKTCGDGLTPRAMLALREFGLDFAGRPAIRGVKFHGHGGSATAPWPGRGAFPQRGSAISRREFDAALVGAAVRAGARVKGEIKALDAKLDSNHVTSILASGPDGQQMEIQCRQLILAEGVRSGVARRLGVEWLRGLVHGVAARSYVHTPFGMDQWIHTHLELRNAAGEAQPGYGWMFPLGDESGDPLANLGCGALGTTSRPAKVNTKKLLHTYAAQCQDMWSITGQPQDVKSALLPMGGAVSRVAGPNWAAIGDTAALVNPLNGEGIDYALESARMVVELLPDAARNPDGLTYMWPARLRREYGDSFSLARRLAMVLTMPGVVTVMGAAALRAPLADGLMSSAVRLMGNLVTPEDRDVVAQLWLGAGRLSRGADRLFAADARPLFGRV